MESANKENQGLKHGLNHDLEHSLNHDLDQGLKTLLSRPPRTKREYHMFITNYQKKAETLALERFELLIDRWKLLIRNRQLDKLFSDDEGGSCQPDSQFRIDIIKEKSNNIAEILKNETLLSEKNKNRALLEQVYRNGVELYKRKHRLLLKRAGSIVSSFLLGVSAAALGSYLHPKPLPEIPEPVVITRTVIDHSENLPITPKRLEDHLKSVKFSVGEPLIVIDPNQQQERLYTVELVEQARYPVSTGRVPGNRRRRGDSRTPENKPGSYFEVVRSPERSANWYFNGERAYGPWFVRFDTPNRNLKKYTVRHPPVSPFGLHGTNHPELLGERASHGCIRHNNAVIDWLVKSNYLHAGNMKNVVGGKERGSVIHGGTKIIIRSGIFENFLKSSSEL